MNYLIKSLFLFAATIPAQSWSADRPTPDKRPLTRAELKECVDLKETIRIGIKNYNDEVNRFNEGVRKSKELGNELKAMDAVIRAGDESKLTEYQEKIALFNDTGKQYDDGQLRLAKLSEESNAVKQDFNAKCANRQFMNADLIQVKKPK